jgi:ATP-dependent DNA ligase
MLLLRTERLPEGPNWLYELKLDGYRALAFKSYGVAHLRSRNHKIFDAKCPVIVAAFAGYADDSLIDNEVVVLDPEGRPSFNASRTAPRWRSYATTSST